jgi:hypothetical protein
MARKADKDSYSKLEAKQRFEAALRGSRNVGPQPMKTIAARKRKTSPDLGTIADLIGQKDPSADFGSAAWKRRHKRQ